MKGLATLGQTARGFGLLGRGGDPAQAMYNKLVMPSQAGRNVMLEYVNATTRYIWTPIIACHWARWIISSTADGFWQITNHAIYKRKKPVDNPDAGITYSGVWDSFPVALTLNSTTRRSQVVGDYLEFTVTGTTEIHVSVTKQANCGYAFVTINGSTALVNGTDMLTSGANRYFNGYAASQTPGQRIQLATGLDPAVNYTVRITHSNEKQAEATDTRVYFEGYIFDAYQAASGAGMAEEATLTLQTGVVNSAIEYAINYKPDGASGYEFTGSYHQNENITATTWKDQAGADLTVNEGAPKASAASVVLTNLGTARHSETGAVDNANVESRCTFDHQGLEVYHKHDWLQTCTIGTAYAGMMPTAAAWVNEGFVVGGTVLALTDNNDAYKGQVKNRLALAWNDANGWVAWLYLPDTIGVDGWRGAGSAVSIQDSAANKKIYAARCYGATIAVHNGDTWEGTHRVFLTSYANPAMLP